MSVLLNTTTAIKTIVVSNETLIWKFSKQYRLFHGWASAVCCFFGIPFNLLNIIVLSQPNMIKSPTNLILIGLAVTDLLTMIAYLPQCIYFYILKVNYKNGLHPDKDTMIWTHFQKNFTMFTVTVHSISIWLTVYLACYRYVFLKTSSPTGHSKLKSPRLIAIKKAITDCFVSCRSYNSTIVLMIFISLFCVTFCIPAYLYPQVLSKEFIPETQDNLNVSNRNRTKEYVYFIAESYLAEKSNGTIWKAMFYSQAIFAKLVPCLLLVTFTFLLIKSLVIINQNKMRLEKMCSHPKIDQKDTAIIPKKKKKTNKEKGIVKKNRASENLRTTLMLVVVCLLFLVTEFPQCMLLICSLIFTDFYANTYTPLGDLMDILALFNNSINFLLYCTMSRAFRDTFYKIISKYFCLEKPPSRTLITQASITKREPNKRNIIGKIEKIEIDENQVVLLTEKYNQNPEDNDGGEHLNSLYVDSKI